MPPRRAEYELTHPDSKPIAADDGDGQDWREKNYECCEGGALFAFSDFFLHGTPVLQKTFLFAITLSHVRLNAL